MLARCILLISRAIRPIEISRNELGIKLGIKFKDTIAETR